MKRAWGHVGILLMTTVLLRGIVIGHAPYTDAGYYAWHSQTVAHNVVRMCTHAGTEPTAEKLMLYPALLFWVSFIPGPPMLYWRIIDGCVAGLAAIALYRMLLLLVRPRPACTAALVWVVASNLPLFIDAGFKNAINIATLCLMCAITALWRDRSWRAAAMAGVWVAMAILLRETFWPHAAALFLLLIVEKRGWRACAAYALAGMATATVAIGIMCVARGGLIVGAHSLLDAYHTQSGASGTPVWSHAWAVGQRVIRMVCWSAPLLIAGIVTAIMQPRNHGTRRPGWLAALLLLAPLVELVTLSTHPYRFVQFLLPGSILAAVACESIANWIADGRRGAMLMVLVSTVWILTWLIVPARALRGAWQQTLHFAPVMLGGDWSSPAAEDSFYLRTARQLREGTHAGEPIAVSGYMYALYLLADRPPIASDVPGARCLTTLSYATTPAQREQFTQDVMRNPPKMVSISLRVPEHVPKIKAMIPEFDERYTLTVHIPQGLRSYGRFSADLYTRRHSNDR